MLGERLTAEKWLNSTVTEAGLAPADQRSNHRLTSRDLVQLRDLRDVLRRILSAAGDAGKLNGMLELTMSSGGDVSATPRGQGADWVRSAVLAECFLAQQHDTWRRLKLCRNHACAAAFYDRSRNNSGVWHDVRVCGNPANLRASRARRRAATIADSA
jgi:predicted RNA-binding Zn ribbon-like protein